MITKIKKYILTFYYLMNSNRRKMEYTYYPIISKQFLYLPSSIIKRMAFLLSVILVVTEVLSVVGTVLLAKYGSNMVFLLVAFSVCFVLAKKFETFDIIDDNDHNNYFHLSAPGLYRIGSVLSVFESFILVSILIASIMHFILNFMSGTITQMILVSICCIFIYMTLKNEMSFFIGVSIFFLFTVVFILKDIFPSDSLRVYNGSENSIYEIYLRMTHTLEYVFFPFVLCVFLWASVVIFFNNFNLVLKRKRHKHKISNSVERSFNSYINYMRKQQFIKKINIMLPLSVIFVLIIFSVFRLPSKWELFPLVITIVMIYNTKGFITYNNYFFHLFINDRDKYDMFNLRNTCIIYKEKCEIILYSRGTLIVSILLFYAIHEPNFSAYNIVILAIMMLFGAAIPLLDKNLIAFNLQDLKLLKSVNYAMNAESISILFIVLLAIITQRIESLGIHGSESYIYLITVIFLLIIIAIRIFMIFEYSEAWRKEL